jgi:hypothetical protein
MKPASRESVSGVQTGAERESHRYAIWARRTSSCSGLRRRTRPGENAITAADPLPNHIPQINEVIKTRAAAH